MEQEVQEIIDAVVSVSVNYGMDVVGAVVILIVGWWVAGSVRRGVLKGLGKVKNFDETLKPFLASIARYAVLVVVIIAVLNQFGVETTSIIAVLGAAGLAIGLALQGTLANVASGVMLLALRPFKVGDFIDAGGVSGSVKEIGLFTTELRTADGVYKVAPNSQLWNSAITNFSRNPTRRIDVLASISYDDDIPSAMKLLEGLMTKDARFLGDPAPEVMVMALGASSVDINLRGWVNSGDYWGALFDLNKSVKIDLEAAGFSIPFPQQDVHMHTVAVEQKS